MFLGNLCNLPLGLKNGKLANRYLTASSSWNRFHAPYLARLRKVRVGNFVGGWSAGINNREQWLQIDLRRPSKIVRCATQGRADVDQWVTSYWISSSVDSLHFAFYTGGKSSYKVCLSLKMMRLKLVQCRFGIKNNKTKSLAM